MKVALVGAIDSPIKKNAVAGTEIWTYNFWQELKRMGHDVTVFASSDSEIEGKIIKTVDSRKLFDSELNQISKTRIAYFSIEQMVKVIEMQDQFDLIHISAYALSYYLPLTALIHKPVVVTVHGPSISKVDAEIILTSSSKVNFALISSSFEKNWFKPPKSKVIYNGIDLDSFKFSDQKEDYYFWMGRIAPEKGVEDAISFAQKTGSKLLIAGPNRKPDYFKEKIQHNLSDKIKYVGELGHDEKNQYYQSAKAFLMPIKWDEPFGLVAIESMACGTPVIAYSRGALPEIISDGVDGFLVKPDDVDGIIKATEKLITIDKKKCRQKVEKKFTLNQMVKNYLNFYQEALKEQNG